MQASGFRDIFSVGVGTTPSGHYFQRREAGDCRYGCFELRLVRIARTEGFVQVLIVLKYTGDPGERPATGRSQVQFVAVVVVEFLVLEQELTEHRGVRGRRRRCDVRQAAGVVE